MKKEILETLFVIDMIFMLKMDKSWWFKTRIFPVTATFQGEDYIPLTNKEIERAFKRKCFLATYCINQKICQSL